MTDRVLEIAPDCIAVMFAIEEGKANISVACGKDTIGKGAHAGKIIKEVAGLVGGKGGVCSNYTIPCGICRQALSEFCGDSLRIILGRDDGQIRVTTLGRLLPEAFRIL